MPFLVGCGTTSQGLSRLSIGMDRAQVLQVMGKPHTVSAEKNVEYLGYNLEALEIGGKREYFVKLVNGRVESYGQKGDFDTTKQPVERKEIHLFKKEEK